MRNSSAPTFRSIVFIILIAFPIEAQKTLNTTQILSTKYDNDQCSSWLTSVVSFDTDSSNGLSEDEFYLFVTSADSPLNMSDNLSNSTNFPTLPWLYRIIYKSLACACTRLKKGPKCCEGKNAEVILDGLIPSGKDSKKIEPLTEYRNFICQLLYFAVNLFEVPTEIPMGFPTSKPSPSDSYETMSLISTTSPSESIPSVSSERPVNTITANYTPLLTPQAETSKRTEAVVTSSVEENKTSMNSGVSNGAVIAIIVSIVALLIIGIGFIAHQRKRKDDRILQGFAGEVPTESGFEIESGSRVSTDTSDLKVIIKQESIGNEKVLDTKKLSLIEELESGQQNTLNCRSVPEGNNIDVSDSESSYCSEKDLHGDENENALSEYEEEQTPTIGSTLAAMGVASTVATNMFRPN